MLFDVLDRKFIIFGVVFWPHDFHVFAILMITAVVMVALFTVVYGRIFCGWICPQTILMEIVFRKIEYWIDGDRNRQKALRRQDWNTEKVLKRLAKHSIFFAISFFAGNVFLSYLIGAKGVMTIITDNPFNHIGGLSGMLVFSGIFYGVFSQLREQVCTVICPYGRLQGALLDKNSVVIGYDYVRGEKRGPVRKNVSREQEGLGDCIDCDQCVAVCPTGIDIRNGTQMECTNCTACIDACDEIMDRIKKPRGLIRYTSEHTLQTGERKKFTAKSIAYTALLVVLVGVSSALLLTRSDIEMTVLRVPGTVFQQISETEISNLFEVVLINKTNDEFTFELELQDSPGRLQMVNSDLTIGAQEQKTVTFLVIYEKNKIEKFQSRIDIGLISDGELLDVSDATFIGPKGNHELGTRHYNSDYRIYGLYHLPRDPNDEGRNRFGIQHLLRGRTRL